MKTSDLVLLGGAALAAYYLSRKTSDGTAQITPSAGPVEYVLRPVVQGAAQDVGAAIGGGVIDIPIGIVQGSWNVGQDIGTQFQDWWNETFRPMGLDFFYPRR